MRANKTQPDSSPGFLVSIDPGRLSPTDGQKRRNAKVLQILASTATVLVRDGHARLSMRAVAAEAGMSLSSLQHYFENKDALLLEALRTIISGYIGRYDDLHRQRQLSAGAILDQIIDDVVAEAARPEVCGLYFEAWAMARHHPEAGDLMLELYRRYFELVVDLVREINPALSPAESRAIAFMFSAQTEGVLVMTHHGQTARPRPGPAPLAASMRQVWAQICRTGLKGASRRPARAGARPQSA